MGERFCDAHGTVEDMSLTLKGSDNGHVGWTLSGSDEFGHLTGGVAQSRSPPAINSHPFRMKKTLCVGWVSSRDETLSEVELFTFEVTTETSASPGNEF